MTQPIKWIKLERTLKLLEMDAFELRQVIDSGMLDEYVDYQKYRGVLFPQLIKTLEVERDISDDERVFKLADVLAIKEQGLIKKEATGLKLIETAPAEVKTLTGKHVSNQHKQKKEQCRKIAKQILKEEPNIDTISKAIWDNRMTAAATKDTGENYAERTIRGWIKDLFPATARKPGKRPKR